MTDYIKHLITDYPNDFLYLIFFSVPAAYGIHCVTMSNTVTQTCIC